MKKKIAVFMMLCMVTAAISGCRKKQEQMIPEMETVTEVTTEKAMEIITVPTEEEELPMVTIAPETEGSMQPAPTQPKPTQPAPTQPKPTQPAPTQPQPTNPAPPQQPELSGGEDELPLIPA